MAQSEQAIRRTTTNKLGVVTLVIPKRFASELGLSQPSDIIIEKREEVLLIRKLEVP